MALVQVENNKGSGKYSWRVQWKQQVNGRRESCFVRLGSTKKCTEKQAKKEHDMILSLVGTVEQGETFDRQQQKWLKNVREQVHQRLEKYGLVRERAARRSASAFSLDSVTEEFLEMKKEVVKAPTVNKFVQTFERLIHQFGGDKDIRDLTMNDAKNYPRQLRKQGKKVRYTKEGVTKFKLDPKQPLSNTYVAKQVDQVKELFSWAVASSIIEVNVFAYGIRTSKKKDETRIRYVTLEETQELFNSQYDLKSLARIVLARLMGLRGAADTLWIRNCDVNFADGDVNRATVTIDSHKNGGRICPMFHDANWIIFKLLCDAEPNPDGYLFKGEREDAVRAGKADCDFSLAEQYAGRYEAYAEKPRIPNLFNNSRSSWVTDLVKIFGQHQHDAAKWIGHSKAIQEEHYLQIVGDGVKDAMSHWKESRVAGLEHTTYFFGMVLDALKDNMPALAQVAEQHAGTITQSAMRGLFSNTDPNTDPIQPKSNSNDPVLQRATPVENEVLLNAEIVELKLQIEGLKRLIASNPVAYRALTDDIPKGVKVAKEGLGKSLSNTLNYRVGKVRVVNTDPNTDSFAHVNRQELDTLLDTDAPECTALVWLQGEVKDALFDQMLKGS